MFGFFIISFAILSTFAVGSLTMEGPFWENFFTGLGLFVFPPLIGNGGELAHWVFPAVLWSLMGGVMMAINED